MEEVITTLLDNGLIFDICYVVNVIGKCIVAAIIAHNNDMSDAKVKAL